MMKILLFTILVLSSACSNAKKMKYNIGLTVYSEQGIGYVFHDLPVASKTKITTLKVKPSIPGARQGIRTLPYLKDHQFELPDKVLFRYQRAKLSNCRKDRKSQAIEWSGGKTIPSSPFYTQKSGCEWNTLPEIHTKIVNLKPYQQHPDFLARGNKVGTYTKTAKVVFMFYDNEIKVEIFSGRTNPWQ